jgi:hypothetical protein
MRRCDLLRFISVNRKAIEFERSFQPMPDRIPAPRANRPKRALRVPEGSARKPGIGRGMPSAINVDSRQPEADTVRFTVVEEVLAE